MGDSRPFEPIRFILAGKSVFTIENTETGNRFTYRVKKADDGEAWFVSLLSGPDNISDYRYMGLIRNSSFRRTAKSKITADAPSFRAFQWCWPRLLRNDLPPNVKVHHEGRCGRCGRVLTVPESIESGFGPECINHV